METIDYEDVVRRVMQRLTEENNVPKLPMAVPETKEDTIPVEMSARHVHLSRKDAKALFGQDLTPVRELSQPGQFLCKERVRLIGPKSVMDNVAVLGPARDQSQVEISLTDARTLGVQAPIRQSGDIAGTPGIILASQNNIIGLDQGVIVAGRHIHMSPEDARRFGVTDGQMVCVNMDGQRPAVFRDVLVRVNPNFRLALHIDADECNSTGCSRNSRGLIIKNQGAGPCQMLN